MHQKSTRLPQKHKVLLPLAWVYTTGVWIRNKLFDCGLLPVEEFSVPVISVGNLTAGGTGKTPHIEYLIEMLAPYYKIAVLSRGYRRKKKGFICADNKTTADQIGDEPYQIHCKYPDITVAVDTNRRRGISSLLNRETPPDIILLDDAHQHRYVRPALSIVLCDYNRPVYNDLPLPAGLMREPLSGLGRANIVILTKCPHLLDNDEYQKEARMLHFDIENIFASQLRYGALKKIGSSLYSPIDDFDSKTDVILFTGIANPKPLIEYIRYRFHNLTILSYPDHHDFTRKEINLLAKELTRKKPPTIIITTEKDAARLSNHPLPDVIQKNMYVLPIKIEMQKRDGRNTFDNAIFEAIRQHTNSND